MKFDLTPQETDVVMTSMAAQPWKVVNPVIQKMMAQANDPVFQGTVKTDEAKGTPEAAPADPAEGDTHG